MLFNIEEYTADSMYRVESLNAYKCPIKPDDQSKQFFYEFVKVMQVDIEEELFEKIWVHELQKNEQFKSLTSYLVSSCSESVPFSDEYSSNNNLPVYRGNILFGYYRKDTNDIIGLGSASVVGDIYKSKYIYRPTENSEYTNEIGRATLRYLLDTQKFDLVELYTHNLDEYPEDHFLLQMSSGVDLSHIGDGSGIITITQISWKNWFDTQEEEFYSYESRYI